MRPLLEREGKKLILNLHPGQARAWSSEAQVVLVLAGTQSGKTCFEPLFQYREIQKVDPDQECDHLAASATYDLMRLKMLPEYIRYFVEDLKWGTFRASDRLILSNNQKQRIIFRTAESDGGLESATAFSAVLDEWGLQSVTVDKFEAVQRRLSIATDHGGGRILIGTTPYCENWVKLCVYDRWKGGDPHYDVIQFRSIDNPIFPRAEYERMRKALPDWKFQMMYNGEFTRPAGLIYTDYLDSYASFDETTGAWTDGGNLVKAFSIPSTWLRDIGVDFGESANCARVWAAEDPTTHYYYIYRDALGGGLNGPEYAHEALSYAEPVRGVVGGAASEDDWRLKWGLAGLAVTEPSVHNVEAGIDHANALFKQRRLFVMDTCTGLRSELGTYSRELDAAGQPTSKIADKQKWHRLDACRYLASRYPLDAPKFTKPVIEEIGGRSIAGIRRRARQFVTRETEEYR